MTPLRVTQVMQSVAHGPLTFRDLTSGDRGITGSEQALLYLSRAFGQAGHEVTCYVPILGQSATEGNVTLHDSVSEWPRYRAADRADVVVSWLSAGFLRDVGKEKLRIQSLQINDWFMNSADYNDYVDVYVYVSQTHAAYLRAQPGYHDSPEKEEVIPNGVDLGIYRAIQETRVPYRCVYISSPDRGLHWLLSIWQEIRYEYPKAELHVYYEVDDWIRAVRGLPSEVGMRAGYVEKRRDELKAHGVVFHGAIPPVALARELSRADLLLYPCDTVSHTEGFGSAVLEAHAAGCVPVITDCDAFGELYGQSGAVVVPREGNRTWVDRYLDEVLRLMGREEEKDDRRQRVRDFARQYDWAVVAERWMEMIRRRLAEK